MGEPARVLDVTPPDDVSALLGDMAVETETKSRKKSSVPTLAGHEELADRAHRAKQAYKQAETEFQMVEQEMRREVDPIYAQRARSGDFSKSFNFAGATTPGVAVRFQDRFSAVAGKHKPALVEALGDRFEQYFTEKRELVLKRTDDATIRTILQAVGSDLFRELFEVKITLAPKKGMDARQFELPDEVRSLLTQNKPSVVAL